MADLISAITSVFTAAIGWVGTVGTTVAGNDILLLSCERYAGKVPLFLGIDAVRFRSRIVPGDTIEIRAVLAKERPEKAIATCHAEVYDNGALAAEGDVTLAMR